MNSHHGTVRRFDQLLVEACSKRATDATAGEPASVFGRLFPVQEQQPETEQLVALSSSMEDQLTESGDSDVPVGMVFFGQFVDHDLTLDVTTRLARDAGDVTRIRNFRSPRLELDSVYLNGPEASPYLFEPGKFRLIRGTNTNPRDLQRNGFDTAVIGDPRNDENLFISQFHGWVSDFHNQIIKLIGGSDPTLEQFEKAREIVRAWYQSVIVTEYLPAIVSSDVLEPLIEGFENGHLPGPVDWASAPDMPVEFSAAAFRFGHSQVREEYRPNHSTASMNLFDFPSFMPVDQSMNLDFDLFFDTGDGTRDYQKSRAIDTVLTPALLNLPTQVVPDTPNLAARNLIRGSKTFLLPSGERVAEYLEVDPIERHAKVEAAGLVDTPLWFYVLAEAEANEGKLGRVGGTIVAGTILNLLLRDNTSIANSSNRVAALSSSSVPATFASLIDH